MAGSATAAGPTTGSKVHRHLQRFRRPWRGVSGSCRPSLKAAARICLSLDIVFLLFLEGCGGADVTVMALVSSSEELKSDPGVEESEGSSDSDPCEESCSGPDDRSECLATKRTVFISSSNGKSGWKSDWTREVLDTITLQYKASTSEVLVSVQKTEDSLRRLKKVKNQNQAKGNSSISDDDKIRLQLNIDVEAYCQQVEQRLNVKPSSIPSFVELCLLVKSTRNL